MGLLSCGIVCSQSLAADDVPIAYQPTQAKVPDTQYLSSRASIQLPGPATVKGLNSHVSAKGQYISWKEHLIDDALISGLKDLSGGDGLKMADLDLDGHLDVIYVCEGDVAYDEIARGYIRVAFGTAQPHVWDLITLAAGVEAGAAEDVAVADVNGDGYPDIVAACELAHLIYFQNPGHGKDVRRTVWARLIPPMTAGREGWIRVFFGDFNQDGRLEVVAANKGRQNPGLTAEQEREISLFAINGDPLDGSSWIEHVVATATIPDNSRPVDLNRDGFLDIFVSVRGGQRLFWLENMRTGDFSFKERGIHVGNGSNSVPVRGITADFADLNGDGRLDIVVADAIPRYNVVWLEQPKDLANPLARWQLHHIGTAGPDSIIGIQLADINGDGHLDLMTGTYSGPPRERDGPEITRDGRLGRIAWFENPGNPYGSWIRHDILRRKRGMFDQFVPFDLNGDGAIDFVGTRGNSHPYDGLYWLEQVRTEEPVPRFIGARDEAHESEQMPLPTNFP